jgi:uncharacterized membrane protein YhhN
VERAVTPTSWVLLVAAALVAPVNWWSRWHRSSDRRVEWVTKPAVTLLILLAAVALTPADDAMRGWFVIAFALCLAGDVLLMLPRERFVPGLAAFLVAHLAAVAGFVAGGLGDVWMGVVMLGAMVVVLLSAGRAILRGARAADPKLGVPVGAYLLAISSMGVAAGFHGDGFGIAGAGCFVASDALLGWNKFVARLPSADVLVMVTYHLALAGLLLALPA